MPRAVDGTKRKDRRNKILKKAKGFSAAEEAIIGLQKMPSAVPAFMHTSAAKTKKAISAPFGLPAFPPPAKRTTSHTPAS